MLINCLGTDSNFKKMEMLVLHRTFLFNLVLLLLYHAYNDCIIKFYFSTLGLAGIITGTVIHSIYKYPETGKKILVASTISGQNYYQLESICIM